MEQRSELLPCPFCGGVAHVEQVGSARQSTIYACEDCSCRLESGEVFKIGQRWNTRATQPAAPADRNKLLSRLANSLAEWQERPQYDIDTAAEIILGDLDRAGFAPAAQSDAFNSAGWRVKHPHGYWYITKDKALVDAYRDEHKMDVQEVFVRVKNAQSEAGK